jgi:hypothetical protein
MCFDNLIYKSWLDPVHVDSPITLPERKPSELTVASSSELGGRLMTARRFPTLPKIDR